jgi:hypothetical protein
LCGWGSNSFIIKGWSLTALGGLYTLYFTTRNYDLLWVTLGCVLLFWFHDAYYLHLERKYRKLYEKVAETESDKIDYSMKPPSTDENVVGVMFRPILAGSYGIILVATLIILYIFK